MNANDGFGSSLDTVLRAVRRGDRKEFDRLVEGYRGFLKDLVERQMDDRLRAVLEPEDVVQDVLLLAYRGIFDARFPNAAAFRGWLEALVRNRLFDLVRRHFQTQRRNIPTQSLDETVSGSDGVRFGESLPSADPSPSSIATRREAAEALEALLVRISPEQREIIRLLEIERLSTREMAARTGKKPATLRKSLARALLACRAAMTQGPVAPSRGERKP